MPESVPPISAAPPLTQTNLLWEEPIAEDEEDENPYRQPTHGEETSPPLSHLQPTSEGGPFRDSHNVELPSSIDGTPPPLPPTEDLPGPRVEAQSAPPRLPEIVLPPSNVQSPEASSSLLYFENDTGTPSPLAPAVNIVTPTVPPVPPPIGLTIVNGENASHRRYTPLSIPGEIPSPGDEYSPVTDVGLARTSRTANFEVVMFGMGEDKVEQLESETSVVSNALLTPNAGVSEEASRSQGLDTFSVSSSDSAPMRGAMAEVKVYPPQGLVGSKVDMVEVHEGRFAPRGLVVDTSAISRNGGPEEHDKDDSGEFEIIATAEVAKLGPKGDLDSESNGNVDSGVVRTAGEVPVSSALARLPSQRSSSSSGNGQEVEDDGWYPRLPTDAVVEVMPKNQVKPKPKPKPKPVSIPVPEVTKTNQNRDTTLKELGRLAKNRPPPIRPPRPPSLGLEFRVLDAVSGENQRFKPLKDRRGQQDRSGVAVSQHREMDQPAPVAEPVQVSFPMRIPTRPSSFSPLTITLDTVSLSDMLAGKAAPAALQPREQADYGIFVSPKEVKEPAGSVIRPAPGGSDILGMEEVLSWKSAPTRPHVQLNTSLDAGQGEFGKRDFGRNAATVQGAKRGFGPSSSGQPHPITLPTPNKPMFGPSTPIFPETPSYYPTRSVPSPSLMPTKSVFEPPTPISIDTQKREAIPQLNNSVPRPTTSMPLDMLPIFPPAPTSSPPPPPRPKHTLLAVQNPDFVPTTPATPAPEYRAPSPPHVAAYEDLRKDIKMPLPGPWASSPSNLTSPEPVVGGSSPTIAPPYSVLERQVEYHPRSSSLPGNQMESSSPPGQSGGITAPPPNGHVQPSLGAGMDQAREGVTGSYYENPSAETSRFPSVRGKEKKNPSFAGVVGALLKAKKLNKWSKTEKHGLASIEEHIPSRGTSEQGHMEHEYKQDAPTTVKPVLPPKQPSGQAHMSPPPFPQQSPPAFLNIALQSLPAQGPTNTFRNVQQIDRDGSISREQRVQPAASSDLASDDARGQPVTYEQDRVNEANQPLSRVRASEDAPSSSSHQPVVTAPPPLVYFPSVPIATHVTSISMRLEAERDSAMSGGDPIPSRNTASLPHIISSLSHLNMRIGEACAILTKVIVSSRIATVESGASAGGADTRDMNVKVEKDMRTRVCEFLTGGIFGRFSVALDTEEDQALREAHGEVFVRCRCCFSICV